MWSLKMRLNGKVGKVGAALVLSCALLSQSFAEFLVPEVDSFYRHDLGIEVVRSFSKPLDLKDAARAANETYDRLNLSHDIKSVTTEDGREHRILRGKTAWGSIDNSGFVEQKGNQVIIALRGTGILSDWLTNLNMMTTFSDFLGVEGGVHTGFLGRYSAVRRSLLETLRGLKLEKNTEFLVTGHSLGGAMATLAAVDLKKVLSEDAHFKGQLGEGEAKVSLRTFCSPRVFNAQAARNANELLGEANIIRAWTKRDLFSAVPFSAIWGYKHVGADRGLSMTLKPAETWFDYLNPLRPHSMDQWQIAAESAENIELSSRTKSLSTWLKAKSKEWGFKSVQSLKAGTKNLHQSVSQKIAQWRGQVAQAA
jgi:hypothetical protein